MTEVLAKIFEPASVGNKGSFRLYDNEVPGPSFRGNLKNEARAVFGLARWFDPRIHDRTANYHY